MDALGTEAGLSLARCRCSDSEAAQRIEQPPVEASCIPRLRWSSWNHRRCSRWSRHERTGCPSASEVCSHADVQPLPRPPLRRNWQSRQGDEGRAVVHSRGLELRRASGTSSLERANRSRGVQCGKSLPAVFRVLMFYTFTRVLLPAA